MRLALIRHGLSVANTENLVTGTVHDALCAIGAEQAQALSEWLGCSFFDGAELITSQWLRAQQTAAVLTEKPWSVDSRIGETNAGIVSQTKLADFLQDYPDFYENPSNRYPKGESHNELNSRVLEWIDERLDLGIESTIAVTHSGPISCIIQATTGLSMDSFPAFCPLNASLSIVEISRNSNSFRGKLICFSSGPRALFQ